jgi:hypothetical protein
LNKKYQGQVLQYYHFPAGPDPDSL